MKRKTIRTVVYPLLAALLWGVAFVFQRMSAGSIGAFTYNASRSSVAAVVLLLFYLPRRHRARAEGKSTGSTKQILLGGLSCGAVLFVAANLQQLGLEGTEAGKAGFITALYIVLVPVFSIFAGKRVSGMVWLSIFIAAAGLFFLCVSGSFTLLPSDILLLVCAVIYALYILVVDRWAPGVDSVALSAVQFAVAGLLAWIVAFIREVPSWEVIRSCAISILYVGIFSSAVAYTLQMAAQQEGDSVTITVLLSQESTFSVIAGALILGEWLTGREYLGCGLMLLAVILAQLPPDFFRNRIKTKE